MDKELGGIWVDGGKNRQVKRQVVRGGGGKGGGVELRYNWAKESKRRISSQGEAREKKITGGGGKKKGEQAESDLFLISWITLAVKTTVFSGANSINWSEWSEGGRQTEGCWKHAGGFQLLLHRDARLKLPGWLYSQRPPSLVFQRPTHTHWPQVAAEYSAEASHLPLVFTDPNQPRPPTSAMPVKPLHLL